MVLFPSFFKTLNNLIDGFRLDFVFDHALMRACFRSAASADNHPDTEFFGGLPDGFFQLRRGGAVIQVMMICAGSSAGADQFEQSKAGGVVHKIWRHLWPEPIGDTAEPPSEVLVQPLRYALHDGLGKVVVSVYQPRPSHAAGSINDCFRVLRCRGQGVAQFRNVSAPDA